MGWGVFGGCLIESDGDRFIDRERKNQSRRGVKVFPTACGLMGVGGYTLEKVFLLKD